MRGIEVRAIAAGQVTGGALMARAGQAVVAAVLGHWPELAGGVWRVLVVCGPGNNGGDGFVIASELAAAGWDVEVRLLGDIAALPPDARAACDQWRSAGGMVVPLADAEDHPQVDLVVDALFGIGLTRPCDAARFVPKGPRVVAVDVPSGLDADTGRVWKTAVPADLTVTFHRAKPGHYLADGPQMCGVLVVADIGLDETDEGVGLVAAPDAPGLAKSGSKHKFSHGHALVLSGGAGRGGAARLAARGALRIGAGLVTVACPPDAVAENAARLDAVMLRPVVDAAGLEGVLADTRINALCLGPALGTGPREAGLVAAGLAARRATVLDADALTLIARDGALFAALHDACVLTPHAGEFARLFADIAARLDAVPTKGPAFSKVDAAREAAARAGCVVLFKGPDTVIAAPDGRCAIHAASYDRAAPWLATAGSGDVLAGFVAGLLARGYAPFDAACTGAWLHAECARDVGPGLIAEDLPEALPAVFRRLGV